MNENNNVILHNNTRLVIDGDLKIQEAKDDIASIKVFEKFSEGRHCEHIPRITTRICGTCSVPHHLTATKALEDAWDVTIPPAALKLRKLMMNAQQYAFHTIQFYSIAAPDFLGLTYGDPTIKASVQILNKIPDIGKVALEMADFGQNLAGEIGGKPVHPISSIVGGIKKPLTEFDRDSFLKQIDGQMELTQQTLEKGLKGVEDNWKIIEKVGVLQTHYLGMSHNGVHDIYEGKLRSISPEGEKTDYNNAKYKDILVKNKPNGGYRSNSLAMINVVDKMGTKLADEALNAFREKTGTISHHLFGLQWVRLIEMLSAIERVKSLLEDPDICNPDCKTLDIKPEEGNGIGITETTRGLLLYHIWSDEDGMCKKLNILNNSSINLEDTEKSVKFVMNQIEKEKILKKL